MRECLAKDGQEATYDIQVLSLALAPNRELLAPLAVLADPVKDEGRAVTRNPVDGDILLASLDSTGMNEAYNQVSVTFGI